MGETQFSKSPNLENTFVVALEYPGRMGETIPALNSLLGRPEYPGRMGETLFIN